MAEVKNKPQRDALAEDFYNPNDVRWPYSPLLKPVKVKITPSPSPPPAAFLSQSVSDSSSGSESCKGSKHRKRRGKGRKKNRPSQGDAVLISFMDGGRRPEIARQAGKQPLDSDGEDEEPVEGTEVKVGKGGVDELSALKAHKGQTVLSSLQFAPVSPDTIVETEIKAERESVEDTREQASPDTTPKSELLPIPSVSTRKPKKRKREN
jgi:hypothetical protein